MVYQFLPDTHTKPDYYNLILEIVYFDGDGIGYSSKINDIYIKLRDRQISNTTIMYVTCFNTFF